MSLSVAVHHAFADFRLDVAFSAPAGVTALFGQSGSGKTSIANAIAGLLKPSAGYARVDDWTLFDTAECRWLPVHERQIGYVFQEARLFPHLSVIENLRYSHRFRRTRPMSAQTDNIIELLAIGPLLQRRPATLSGGEKQRVAIGRALLSEPHLLLMDEPLASLDEARKAEILPYLERLRDQTTVPVLYVSHSIAEIARLATTIVVIKAGRVAQIGAATEVLSDPAAVPTLGVQAAASVLAGKLIAHHSDGLSEIALSAGRLLLPSLTAPVGAIIRVRIAANDVLIAKQPPAEISALNVIDAKITRVHRGEGPGVVVQMQAGSDRLLARITQRSAEALRIESGGACYAVVKSVAVAPADVWTG